LRGSRSLRKGYPEWGHCPRGGPPNSRQPIRTSTLPSAASGRRYNRKPSLACGGGQGGGGYGLARPGHVHFADPFRSDLIFTGASLMRNVSIRGGGADTTIGIHRRVRVSPAIGHKAGQQVSPLVPKQSEVRHSEAGSKEPHAAAEDSWGTLRIAWQYQQNSNVSRSNRARIAAV